MFKDLQTDVMEYETNGRTLLTLLIVASLFIHDVSTTNGLELEDFIANTCITSEDDSLKTMTSYHECIRHCKVGSDCAAVSYMQKGSLCRLNSAETATPGPCQGYVHSQKASWEMASPSQCSCPNGHRCESNGGCVPSKCDKLEAPEYGQKFGTLFSVGDKVAFICNHGYLRQGAQSRKCTARGTWSEQAVTCTEDPWCNSYLVSGPEGVRDDQLTESSYWCTNDVTFCTNEHDPRGMSAKYARINSTGWITGGWSAQNNNLDQYIQVDFMAPRTISAVVLQGRDPGPQDKYEYVTKFKVLHSFDCTDFKVITANNGTDMVFEGNSNRDESVTRNLPERTGARCVRLNPIQWNNFISLRFDILGC